jgi:hypothetical protein
MGYARGCLVAAQDHIQPACQAPPSAVEIAAVGVRLVIRTQRLRLARARESLSGPEVTVLQVALAYGSQERGAFARLSGREVGQPPGRYRAHPRSVAAASLGPAAGRWHPRSGSRLTAAPLHASASVGQGSTRGFRRTLPG